MFKDLLLKELIILVPSEFKKIFSLFPTDNFIHGDLTTNIAMVIAQSEKTNPQILAKELIEKIKKNEKIMNLLEKVEMAGVGYINFYFKEKLLIENLNEILNKKENYGRGDLYKDKKIMIEFGHPNPFKIMHIGHLRNFAIGESLVRLFEFQGAEVIRTNYQGDVGMHIAKCLWGILKSNKEQNTKISEIEKKSINGRIEFLGNCYVLGAKAFEESEENKKEIQEINRLIYSKENNEITALWQLGVKWSLDKFHEMYQRLNTHFDREYMESETLEIAEKKIAEAIRKKILIESKGAIVFIGKNCNLDTRVFLNSQKLPTYEGKELGLAEMEFTDFGKLDLCIHNVAVEQISFFKVTFKVEELLDPDKFKGKQYHNAYEFVGLKTGKMSSRKGQIVTAESILDEAHEKIKKIVKQNNSNLNENEVDKIAVSAIKYGYLRMSPFKYLAFDLEASVSFSGDSGPYLQYTYARCQSVLRKVNSDKNYSLKASVLNGVILSEKERLLLRKLYQFTDILTLSVKKYSPSYLVTYLNELAQAFNSFYNESIIIGAKEGKEVENFRLNLTASIAQIIKSGLNLLGIQTVEKM